MHKDNMNGLSVTVYLFAFCHPGHVGGGATATAKSHAASRPIRGALRLKAYISCLHQEEEEEEEEEVDDDVDDDVNDDAQGTVRIDR
jgi:hypothetical protein